MLDDAASQALTIGGAAVVSIGVVFGALKFFASRWFQQNDEQNKRVEMQLEKHAERVQRQFEVFFTQATAQFKEITIELRALGRSSDEHGAWRQVCESRLNRLETESATVHQRISNLVDDLLKGRKSG